MSAWIFMVSLHDYPPEGQASMLNQDLTTFAETPWVEGRPLAHAAWRVGLLAPSIVPGTVDGRRATRVLMFGATD
jgi:hypothetical protein